MKTLIYTGYDKAYEPLAQITVPRMSNYAAVQGYDFSAFTPGGYMDPIPDVPNGIYWTGVRGALTAFDHGYNRVMYLDVDQLITNYDKSGRQIVDRCRGLNISKDWGEDATEPWQFSACGWIAYPDCIPMFQAVWNMEPKWRDKPFPEQGPWQAVVRMIQKDCIVLPGQIENGRVKEPDLSLVNVCSRRTFNAVPEQVCPGKVPEPWQPGDFAAHLTMLPLEDRIKLAHSLIKEHGL